MTPGARESDLGRTGLIAVAGLLIMWEALGRLDVSMFVPPVTTVAAAWWHLVGDGTLTRAAASSLVSLVKGFVPAAVLGVAVGLAMGRFATVLWTLLLAGVALTALARLEGRLLRWRT